MSALKGSGATLASVQGNIEFKDVVRLPIRAPALPEIFSNATIEVTL
jgi:hypothetical protein